MKRLEVEVLARIGGKNSGEASPRVSSGAVESATCRMPLELFSSQDGATSARRQTHLARRVLVRHCETETRSSTRAKQPLSRAPWDQQRTWLWTGLRSCTPRRPWHRSCNLRRSRRWASSSERCARVPSGQVGVYSRQDVHGDSDWAGDEERKLAEIFGGHPLDAASATQSLVALSSAEAEFYACNRGTAGGLQTCHFLTEAVYHVVPRVWSDSSAWRGIVRGQGAGRLRHLQIRHMWTQERLQIGALLLVSVRTDENVASRVEELLSELGVRRCARSLVVASLITTVGANHFDHMVAIGVPGRGCCGSSSRVGCARSCWAYCCWRWCCRDTTTRECQASLPKRGGISEHAVAIESECSARRRLIEAVLRDELRIALRRRGLPARGAEGRLDQETVGGRGALALTEEAAVALLFVRRRLGSRLGGLALTDDAGDNRVDR